MGWAENYDPDRGAVAGDMFEPDETSERNWWREPTRLCVHEDRSPFGHPSDGADISVHGDEVLIAMSWDSGTRTSAVVPLAELERLIRDAKSGEQVRDVDHRPADEQPDPVAHPL